MRRVRRLFCAAVFSLVVAPVASGEPSVATGWQSKTAFRDYSPLSRTSELMRRLFSPLQALRAEQAIARSGQRVSEQSIDLTQETFGVYVPASKPRDGYALLVFIPPWEEAKLPAQWTGVFDKHGMIYVTAANSGNGASVLDRREPLALLAAHNIAERYSIDPARTYIGGYSGGSRVAMRLALAYPDLFRGALLNAGSDPIGNAQIPLPPADLMHRFQESTRLVYLTGKGDAEHVEMDEHSRRSMLAWCVFNTNSVFAAWSGHEVVSAGALDQALNALERRETPGNDKLAACRENYQQALSAELRKVEQLRASGKADESKALLDAIDTRYGGLAAPKTVELAEGFGAKQ